MHKAKINKVRGILGILMISKARTPIKSRSLSRGAEPHQSDIFADQEYR
jgi:hypothetical protein